MNRRLLDLGILLVFAALVSLICFRPGAKAPPSGEVRGAFTIGGVAPGMKLEDVVRSKGPGQSSQNERGDTYTVWGAVSVLPIDGVVDCVYGSELSLDDKVAFARGDGRERVHEVLGQPLPPEPCSPHQAPEYEQFKVEGYRLEVRYEGDHVSQLAFFRPRCTE